MANAVGWWEIEDFHTPQYGWLTRWVWKTPLESAYVR